MINYKWIISGLETSPQEGSLTDVVKTIHWRLKADQEGSSVDVYDSLNMNTVDEENFVAFEDLTEEQVISWLESSLDVESLKQNLQQQLENQSITARKTSPWLVKSNA